MVVMFLRRHRKSTGGEEYTYWTLVQTYRSARGPRHRIVAHLGKLDGGEQSLRRSWEELDALLEGRAVEKRARQLRIGESAVSERRILHTGTPSEGRRHPVLHSLSRRKDVGVSYGKFQFR